MNNDYNKTICVVGLGYVGLPLAIEFGKKYNTIGYDIDENKINNYKNHIDESNEVMPVSFLYSRYITFTNDKTKINEADFVIISVPTPVTNEKVPDFTYLIEASKIVAKNMKKGCIIIYESTVYPGATEDICLPILKEYSKYSYMNDFNIGYSPERINPGDREHTLSKVVKIVSGDNEDTLLKIKDIYSSIIDAGVYEVSSIKVAEAAKVIENIQRDVNIALMNELSLLFDKMNIDTYEVLSAAKSKWNFLDFSSGLVGGHCIGVDPYYLTHIARKYNYSPDMILAGRRINDSMSKFIVDKTIKKLIQNKTDLNNTTIGIFGLTFKANCSDMRNSKVFDIIDLLSDYNFNIKIFDPYINDIEKDPWLIKSNTNILDCEHIPVKHFDVIILAVDHDYFKIVDLEFYMTIVKNNGIIIDVKSILDNKHPDIKNMGERYWRM